MSDASADIIVIGGGIIGLAAAQRLARAGNRVVLLERAFCGGEASWAGGGLLAPVNPHRTDGVAILQERSLDLYPQWCAQLHDETGIDPEYELCGELTLLFSEDAVRLAREDVAAGAGRTMPDGTPVYRMLTPEEARQLDPIIGPTILAAMECRRTAQVRNPRLLRALVTSCINAGVRILEQTAVTDLLRDGDRVVGVNTSDAKLFANRVVLCAGAWSSQIGQQLETMIPVRPVRGQMILLQLPRRTFTRTIGRGRTYLVPRRDGHVLLGATEEPEAGYEKRNTPAAVSKLMHTAMEMAPTIEQAEVVTMWSGLRPGTPDDLPYIGAVPGFEGLFAATGHYRNGLALAPATAEVIAAAIEGRAYDIDLSVCRPGRKLTQSEQEQR